MFGEVAELYDRVRPTYPAPLVEDVLEFAALGQGARLLESGAGTGKATRLVTPFLVPKGWSLTALEPDPAMAAVLSGHLVGELTAGRAEVVVEGLEQFVDEVPTDGPPPYDLLYAAQSWHWVDAGRRAGLAARALRPGGTLALIWNVGSHPDPDLRGELDRIYADFGPAVSWQPIRSTPTRRSDANFLEVLGRDYGAEIAASRLFSPLEVAQREWSTSYDAETWTTLLRTHSDHRLLEPDQLEQLLARVAEVVRRFGVVRSEYRTIALLARRLA